MKAQVHRCYDQVQSACDNIQQKPFPEFRCVLRSAGGAALCWVGAWLRLLWRVECAQARLRRRRRLRPTLRRPRIRAASRVLAAIHSRMLELAIHDGTHIRELSQVWDAQAGGSFRLSLDDALYEMTHMRNDMRALLQLLRPKIAKASIAPPPRPSAPRSRGTKRERRRSTVPTQPSRPSLPGTKRKGKHCCVSKSDKAFCLRL